MNSNNQSNQNSPDHAGIKSQLKQLGNQIEAIAKQLKGLGNQQDIDELFELGDKVEHFCDNMDFTPVANAKDKAASLSSPELKTGSGIQTGQKNQDEESPNSQKPNPVM